MPLLEVEHVSRHFGGVMAVDDVSLSLAEGEILGLIGPNGAGKSTLFNLMSGIVRPDRGRIRFGGRRDHRIAGPTRYAAAASPGPFSSCGLSTSSAPFRTSWWAGFSAVCRQKA